jgi:hypothetical protein
LYNCIIQGSLGNSTIYNEGQIFNTIFLGNGSTVFCYYAQNMRIENSIFVGVIPSIMSSASSTTHAYNNISFSSGNNTFNTANQSGNMIGDPLFVSVGNAFSGYHPMNNYQLQMNSPGHLAGTDGKDIGLYGGFPYFTNTGEPDIPQIRSFNVPLTPIPAGSNITIDFTSTVKP